MKTNKKSISLMFLLLFIGGIINVHAHSVILNNSNLTGNKGNPICEKITNKVSVPKDFISLYTQSNSHVAGYSWKLKAKSTATGKIGVTYAQKVGLCTTYSTVTITIAPGQIKDLGYGQFGTGDHRKVWIVAAWWD
jgi:hypothetical protein